MLQNNDIKFIGILHKVINIVPRDINRNPRYYPHNLSETSSHANRV